MGEATDRPDSPNVLAKGAPINNRFIWNFMGDDVVMAVEAGVVASLRA